MTDITSAVLESLSRGGPSSVPKSHTSSVTGMGAEPDSCQAHLLLAFGIMPDDDSNENDDGNKDDGVGNDGKHYNGHEENLQCVPSGIAVTKSGDYVIVDNTNKQVKVFTRSGDYMKFAFGVGLLNDPWDVFISETGKIVVSDSMGGLKVFSSKGKFLQASELGCHLMDPKGVAYHHVTKELFIADPVSSCVYVHDPDGIVTSILTTAGNENFTAPTYIHTDSYANIYISDTAANKIYAFDSEKQYKFTFGMKTFDKKATNPNALINPGALVTDRYGNLLIADTGKSRVLAIASSTGETRGDVLTWEDGLVDPLGLAIDHNTGNLVVTEATTGLVKVFAYDHLPCCIDGVEESANSYEWTTEGNA